MTADMSAYIQELQKIPDQKILLTRVTANYPPGCPVTTPGDQAWMHWWVSHGRSRADHAAGLPAPPRNIPAGPDRSTQGGRLAHPGR